MDSVQQRVSGLSNLMALAALNQGAAEAEGQPPATATATAGGFGVYGAASGAAARRQLLQQAAADLPERYEELKVRAVGLWSHSWWQVGRRRAAAARRCAS